MPRSLLTATCAVALLAFPAAASAKDRNHDGLPDGWERAHRLSLSVNQSGRDPDHDGLTNRAEFRDHTNPRKADTDGDGLNDGAEVATHNDPLKRDSNGDGIPDGEENAGVIASFDGTMLTITAGSTTISGTVTSATEIECDNAGGSTPTATAARDGESSGGSGDSGSQASSTSDTSGSGSGDQQGGDETGSGDGGQACGTADLTPGTAVHEARLSMTSAGDVFTKVELER